MTYGSHNLHSDACDNRVFCPGNARLELNPDLRFHPQPGTQPHYVIEDPLRSKFHRVGIPEYTFITLLDGTRTIDQAIAETAQRLPMRSFTESDGLLICRWLVDTELAHGVDRSSHPTEAEPGEILPPVARWNPFIFRLPLLHPDRIFVHMTPWLGWIYSWGAFLVWLLCVCTAGYLILTHWERFWSSSQNVFVTGNWVWLGLSWLFLKVIHETGHGVACRRYGGAVREAGLVFILFAPLAYADVTSSWRFRSRWQRIVTALGGIYVELFCAALATFVWAWADVGPLHAFCFNLVVMAGFTTLLFNANPLMRFDGYYVLSDLLEIPNLHVLGHQYVRCWLRKVALGVNAPLPNWPEGSGKVVRCYGLAAAAWRIFIMLGLLLAASVLFHGAGMILVLMAVALWLGRPTWTAISKWRSGTAVVDWWRISRVGVLSGAALFLLFVVIPWPGRTSAPALVTYSPLVVQRAPIDGFVREIHVRDGEQVVEGQLLLVLENRDLEIEIAGLRIEVAQSEIKARQFQKNEQIAAFQAEFTKLQQLGRRLAEQEERLSGLRILAQTAGHVIAPYLDTRQDAFVEEGTELVSVGTESRKELLVSIPQDEIESFAGALAREVRVRLVGSGTAKGRLDELSPRASIDPPERAFCASFGGPLPVQMEAPSAGKSETTYQFFEPRFSGTVSLTEEASRALRAGQPALVSFWSGRESVGGYLYRRLSRWVRTRLEGRAMP